MSQADVTQGPDIELTRVNSRIYSAIGATQAPSYDNWGHNNNLSFVVGTAGVLVVNGGDNYLLARALHREIGKITNIPVRWVVNENGQGHAFLGNSYWQQQGATVIAHRDAAEEIRTHGQGVLHSMLRRNGERGIHTSVVVPEQSFAERMEIDLGDQVAELLWFGNAHSPGDISIWLPGDSVLIAGDIAFHERLLGVFPDTDVLAWIDSFEKMQRLRPGTIVPGHGGPARMVVVAEHTHGYLKFLVGEVQKILQADGDLSDAYQIDQSSYAHLDTFEELAVKNAGRVFQQLELEYF